MWSTEMYKKLLFIKQLQPFRNSVFFFISGPSKRVKNLNGCEISRKTIRYSTRGSLRNSSRVFFRISCKCFSWNSSWYSFRYVILIIRILENIPRNPFKNSFWNFLWNYFPMKKNGECLGNSSRNVFKNTLTEVLLLILQGIILQFYQ